MQAVKELSKELKLQENISLSQIISMPGVVALKEDISFIKFLWPSVQRALKTALDSMDKMRILEGIALHKDIYSRIQHLSNDLNLIKNRIATFKKEKQATLTHDEMLLFLKPRQNQKKTILKELLVCQVTQYKLKKDLYM